MSKFVSYAQNCEDVILWRALRHVEHGFYIDAGANDPDMDSVTKAFYERGWRGINIEPIEEWHERLKAHRPRDINLAFAVGSASGELIIHEVEGTGLSTSDEATAERHVQERGYHRTSRTVPVETLSSICERYHQGPIHFLKIDVEGAEKAVLEGFDLQRFRPWIMVIESTLPNSPVQDYETWEPMLLEGRYKYVYFDGLNRYYLAEEHSELAASFEAPPNVFDGFVSAHVVLLERQIEETLQQASRLDAWARELSQKVETEARRADAFHHRVCSLEAKNSELDEQHRRAFAELALIRRSLSWRLTKPVRWLGFQLRLLRRHGWKARVVHLLRRMQGLSQKAGSRHMPEEQLNNEELPPLASRLHHRILKSVKTGMSEGP